MSSMLKELEKNRDFIESQKPGNFTYNDYQENDAVKKAQALLQQHIAQKPGNFQFEWQTQLDDIMGKIMNRENFSYDMNGDALYQQYKNQFTQQGKMAMMDTMGQAQAMTGGYGNSYAQSVGQQAYQSHLQQLNDKIPALYQLALDKYNAEGQNRLNQYAMLGDRRAQDYGMHRDTVSDYRAELDRLTGDYRYESERDYGRYMDSENMRLNEHQDAMSNWQFDLDRADSKYANQAELEEAQRQHNEQMDLAKNQLLWDRAQALLESTEVDAFVPYTFSRVDEDGNHVYYYDGKEYTFAPGVNPYTGTKNPDVQHGKFDNGYQPNNIANQALTVTEYMDEVNGVMAPIYKTPDGRFWVWDDLKNQYEEIDLSDLNEEEEPKTEPDTDETKQERKQDFGRGGGVNKSLTR